MKKILFLAILLGALLFAGVVKAGDGTCICDVKITDPPKVKFDSETVFSDPVECLAKTGTTDDTVGETYSNCKWKEDTPASEPASDPGGGAPAGGSPESSVVPSSAVTPAADDGGQIIELGNPLGEGRIDIRAVLGDIIKYTMGILGSLTLLVFVFGGFLWLTSAGNDERVKKGSQTMIWAVIGIFIIFASYGILSLVLQALGARNAAEKPWGYQAAGGEVQQTEASECVPVDDLDFENECNTYNGEPANCAELNGLYGSEICQYLNDICTKKMSEGDYCHQFNGDPTTCVGIVSKTCEIASNKASMDTTK